MTARIGSNSALYEMDSLRPTLSLIMSMTYSHGCMLTHDCDIVSCKNNVMYTNLTNLIQHIIT